MKVYPSIYMDLSLNPILSYINSVYTVFSKIDYRYYMKVSVMLACLNICAACEKFVISSSSKAVVSWHHTGTEKINICSEI